MDNYKISGVPSKPGKYCFGICSERNKRNWLDELTGEKEEVGAYCELTINTSNVHPTTSSRDFTALEKAIKAAETLNADDYTAESWGVLQNALNKYKSILKTNVSQADIDAAAEAINSALRALVKKTVSGGAVSNVPRTGANDTGFLVFAGLMLPLAALGVFGSRRKKSKA